jgi:hypothetical protein
MAMNAPLEVAESAIGQLGNWATGKTTSGQKDGDLAARQFGNWTVA